METSDVVRELEAQIQERRIQTGQDQSAPIERSDVHTAIGEQIQQLRSTVPSGDGGTTGNSTTNGSGSIPSDLVSQVQVLVNVAFTEGTETAIKQALASGNAALVDALHDILADQLHTQLLARGKLEPAP